MKCYVKSIEIMPGRKQTKVILEIYHPIISESEKRRSEHSKDQALDILLKQKDLTEIMNLHIGTAFLKQDGVEEKIES